MKFLLSIFLLLGACAPLVRQTRTQEAARLEVQARLRNSASPSILFIGNSYSFGLPAELQKIAAEHGKQVRTGHSTYSGWTLAKHAKHKPTLEKIRTGKWDVVVIQEFSLNPAKFSMLRDAQMFPPLQALAGEARNAGAIPVLYQTWGRRNAFEIMNPKIRDGYRAASKKAGGLYIVPVGDAWEKEVNAGKSNELFMPDGSHPTPAGVHLNAETFYRAFFG